MNLDKIKKPSQNNTLQIRVTQHLKNDFIEACEKKGYSYSAVMREMIKDFISDKYININDSTYYELQDLASLYNMNIDDVIFKIVYDRYNIDIMHGNNK